MLHNATIVGTRRAAFMEQVGQTKHTALLDFAFPHQKRGTPRPYINKHWANDQRQSKKKLQLQHANLAISHLLNLVHRLA